MESPPLYVMKKLIAKYNKDLKISGYSKMKKDDLHATVKKKKYKFHKKNDDEWDLVPSSEMKRQGQYTYNKKTKTTTGKSYIKNKK